MGDKLKLAVPKGDQEENLAPNEGAADSQKKDKKSAEVFVKEGVEIYTDPLKRTKKGLLMMLLGFFGSFIVFEATYWLISNFDLAYYWQSLIAVIFAFMAIQIYNKATGDVPSLLKTPIVFFTIILFSLSLLVGYHHNAGKSAGYLDNIFWTAGVYDQSDYSVNKKSYNYQKQFGIVRNPGETWLASGLPENTMVTIKIRGAAVIIDGEKLLPSDYAIETDKNGNLEFIGTKKITTSIEVIP